MRRQVRAGVVPGIIAYDAEGPVGWCAVEPRSAYPRLARSRTLAPVDEQQVWSVPCFFVARRARHTGLTPAARGRGGPRAPGGAAILEGYPVDPRGETADAWLYTGLASTFAREGFDEVARRSPTRPVMRRPQAGAESTRSTWSCTRPFESRQFPEETVERPGEVGEAAAGLLDQDLERRDVPDLHPGLDPGLGPAGQHHGRSRPGRRSSGPGPP